MTKMLNQKKEENEIRKKVISKGTENDEDEDREIETKQKTKGQKRQRNEEEMK